MVCFVVYAVIALFVIAASLALQECATTLFHLLPISDRYKSVSHLWICLDYFGSMFFQFWGFLVECYQMLKFTLYFFQNWIMVYF